MQIKLVTRMIGASLAWAALITKFNLVVTSADHATVAAAVIHYFGFFTHLTNILVALAFTASILRPNNSFRRFFERPAVRGAIALYILVVAVVYEVLLAHQSNHQGVAALTSGLLHIVIPALYLLDWVLFARKKPMRYTDIPYWLIYPFLYAILSIAKGMVLGTYPYSFLDAGELGFAALGINILGFVVLFAGGAAFFILLGRLLPHTIQQNLTEADGR